METNHQLGNSCCLVTSGIPIDGCTHVCWLFVDGGGFFATSPGSLFGGVGTFEFSALPKYMGQYKAAKTMGSCKSPDSEKQRQAALFIG